MKKQYKVLNPISLGGRIERGTIIELDDFTARAFDKNDIEIYTPEEEIEVATEGVTPQVEEVKTPEDVVNAPEVTPEIAPETEPVIETKTEEVTPQVEA